MEISLKEVGKKYGKQQVLTNVTHHFPACCSVGITGSNGSGKSTLLKIIGGMLTQDAGEVIFKLREEKVDVEDVWQHLSFCAPYLELPGDLTFEELWRYHSAHRSMKCDRWAFSDLVQIDDRKQIRSLSSGMQQRLKLALAVFTDSSVLLLDEPTSNFDDQWKAVYLQWMQQYSSGRTVVISSNEPAETAFCRNVIRLG